MYNQLFSTDTNNCSNIIPEIEFGQTQKYTKGWGLEEWICNTNEFCGKLLLFNAGYKFSAHFHKLKNEVFFLRGGQVKLIYFNLANADQKERILNPGDTVYIPAGQIHQIEAILDSEIIEFSTPHYMADNYRVVKGSSQLNDRK